MRSMIFSADDLGVDVTGNFVQKSRTWPVSPFGGDIGEVLEVAGELSAIRIFVWNLIDTPQQGERT